MSIGMVRFMGARRSRSCLILAPILLKPRMWCHCFAGYTDSVPADHLDDAAVGDSRATARIELLNSALVFKL